MSPWPSRLAIVAALATGCADEPGDLDPGVVNDIATDQGDAVGVEWSGVYAGELRLVACDCRHEELAAFSLCGAAPGQDIIPAIVEVVQADGIVLLAFGDGATTSDLTLTGPIDQDGSFEAGLVFDITTPVTQGDAVTRTDGSFENNEDGAALTARLRHRIEASANKSSVECSEEHSLSAQRAL